MTNSAPGLGWPEDAGLPPDSPDITTLGVESPDTGQADSETASSETASTGSPGPGSSDTETLQHQTAVHQTAVHQTAVHQTAVHQTAVHQTAVEADADAWLTQIAGAVPEDGVRRRYEAIARSGELPERYARRASRMGLGWPGGSKVGSRVVQALRPGYPHQPGEGEEQRLPSVEVGLGASSDAKAAEPVPERVRQALASVSRETNRLVGSPAAAPMSRNPVPRGSAQEVAGDDSGRPDPGRADTDSS